MTEHVLICAHSAPPIDPSIHRRIAMRRLGLRDATARLIAELAYGQPRDAVVLVAIADAGTLIGEVRR